MRRIFISIGHFTQTHLTPLWFQGPTLCWLCFQLCTGLQIRAGGDAENSTARSNTNNNLDQAGSQHRFDPQSVASTKLSLCLGSNKIPFKKSHNSKGLWLFSLPTLILIGITFSDTILIISLEMPMVSTCCKGCLGVY